MPAKSYGVELHQALVNVQWVSGLLAFAVDMYGNTANFDIKISIEAVGTNGAWLNYPIFEKKYIVKDSYDGAIPGTDDGPTDAQKKAFHWWSGDLDETIIEGTVEKQIFYYINFASFGVFFSELAEQLGNNDFPREVKVTIDIPAGQTGVTETTRYYTWDLDADTEWNPIPPLPYPPYIWSGGPDKVGEISAAIALIMSNNPGYHLELRSELIQTTYWHNIGYTIFGSFIKKDEFGDYYTPDGYVGVLREYEAPIAGSTSPSKKIIFTAHLGAENKAEWLTYVEI